MSNRSTSNAQMKMIGKIWRALAQILYYRNDLIEIIKPFFENLKNENINDEKYIPLLKTFSKGQLEGLYQYGIITEEKFNYFIRKNSKNQNNPNTNNDEINDDINDEINDEINNEINNVNIEAIISGDKIEELQDLIQKNDIQTFNIITKEFFEVEAMKIPLIQYCIMKKSIECFKYLLVNGFDDPKKILEEQKTLEEQNSKRFHYNIFGYYQIKIFDEFKRYDWDSMATAIFFGNKEIVRILEERVINKGARFSHLDAAILSYRNHIAVEIFEEIDEGIDFCLQNSLIYLASNNNIKGAELIIRKDENIAENISKDIGEEMLELLISKRANINAIDIIYLNMIILF